MTVPSSMEYMIITCSCHTAGQKNWGVGRLTRRRQVIQRRPVHACRNRMPMCTHRIIRKNWDMSSSEKVTTLSRTIRHVGRQGSSHCHWLLDSLQIRFIVWFYEDDISPIIQVFLYVLGAFELGLKRNGVFNFSRNTIIASCWMWLSWLSQLFSPKR